MKQIHILLVVGIVFSICLSSCKKDDRKNEAQKIIAEWVGKTIEFPSNMTLSVYGKDTMLADFHSTPYKILLYVDSSGCTSCRLKLYEWHRLIADADSTLHNKLSFIFCFQPKNTEELTFLFRRDRFAYPIVLDEHNLINKLNHFPSKTEFQCFLLDKNNKVLSIGNPTLNPKIWGLYKQIVTGEIATNKAPNTEIELIDKAIELTDVKIGVKHKMTFRIKNIGKNPLAIVDVKTSCGCTNAAWEKQPIEQHEITEIKADIVLDNAGYFAKTLQVYCNVDNSPIVLTIKGNAK